MHIDVVQAQRTFEALLDRMLDGDDIVITRDNIPVARLVAMEVQLPLKVRLGGLQHIDPGLSADFHAPMTDHSRPKQN